MEVYTHLTCSTAKRALKWLDSQGYTYHTHNIKEETPDRAFFEYVLKEKGMPVKKVLNTSGEKYKALGLKDKLDTLSIDEVIDLLVSDGMLIKRPVIIEGALFSFGAKEVTLEEAWGK
ncbi:Spx/MgsR family RNA polymerase-binding regulatory protein [Granulicatella sp. zg-ZJ]|uniref:Spx/MgsR family RNA polymerase-binding regulatory protein n=1 Tax=unclassified Granulicatella TaxID=2630493 RepID=UPI0013C1A0A1|nr:MULTISPECIES: Spx/MgsR family RNA polymerase-binding regulatory protein [unclassified Granulicatella]MBS4750872.1 Spx/MgsR family RNA polymerase-binding regulatory protein [Carnobacteriaceae bacterium zg-ZUI78]NEW62739.1 Spx/MgsR family RNA polymerase-binding regulatory protein [Granulicatella sp. zg-ZJ]NEW65561.1 Spx/MgsR family RNA polymerase-binding regulatory protein [Granulicatella sp. zg-84]QMI85558.1 Spx/MgsR family RNA polymerase-binding regulatory protein [Carnobacteriaceae bacteriu